MTARDELTALAVEEGWSVRDRDLDTAFEFCGDVLTVDWDARGSVTWLAYYGRGMSRDHKHPAHRRDKRHTAAWYLQGLVGVPS